MTTNFITLPKQTILCLLVGFCVTFPAKAASETMKGTEETSVSAGADGELPLRVRNSNDDKKKGFPSTNSPIRIPEVTKDDHTFHFITPCTGLTFQLVQGDEVCYEAVITSDYLEIPADITGVYELQIVRGVFVFFTEVEL